MRLNKIVITLIVCCLLFAGCAKNRAGETPEQTATRKKAVYCAQAVTALQGWSDMTALLERGAVMSEARANTAYEINEKALTSLDLVRKRLKDGFPSKEILPIIETILVDLDAAEKAGLIGLEDEEARAKFQQVIFSVRFTINSIKAILAAIEEPSLQQARQAARQAVRTQGNPPWWTEAVLIIQTTVIKMLEQSRLDTEVAWADADTSSGNLHRLNAERKQ